MTSPKQEVRKFRMHENLIYTTIKSQAGSLSKALCELCSNALDANATRVDITLEADRFIVADDGHGFQSREAIENHFETFGTPHQEGDSRVGRFRVGRGQAMAFAATVWTSGEFVMSVDIRGRGLDYDLKTVANHAPGCKIEGALYTPLSAGDLLQNIENLRRLVRWSPLPVYVNGELITEEASSAKWSHETDDAMFMLREGANQLEIYSLGFFVTAIWSGELGMGGCVNSKKALIQNVARTDVLRSECETFRQIAHTIRGEARKREEKKPVQDEAYRASIATRLVRGAYESQAQMERDLHEARVITDITGKHMSFRSLLNAVEGASNTLVWVNKGTVLADKAHAKKLAVVVSGSTLNRFGMDDFTKVMYRLRSNLMTLGKASASYRSFNVIEQLLVRVKTLDEVTVGLKSEHEVVERKRLSKEEKVCLKIIDSANWTISRALKKPKRYIHVCDSQTVDGFTDGGSYIFINRRFLKVPGTMASAWSHWTDFVHMLVHEYTHDEVTSETHLHGVEFYESFHNAFHESDALRRMPYYMFGGHVKARQSAGLKLRAAEKEAVDILFSAFDGDSVVDEVDYAVSSQKPNTGRPADRPTGGQAPVDKSDVTSETASTRAAGNSKQKGTGKGIAATAPKAKKQPAATPDTAQPNKGQKARKAKKSEPAVKPLYSDQASLF